MSKLDILKSHSRIIDKNNKFADIFGYLLVHPVKPHACLFGPQEESDAFEAKLDKCIADKVDYFAEEFGYDSQKKREEVEKNEYIFID